MSTVGALLLKHSGDVKIIADPQGNLFVKGDCRPSSEGHGGIIFKSSARANPSVSVKASSQVYEDGVLIADFRKSNVATIPVGVGPSLVFQRNAVPLVEIAYYSNQPEKGSVSTRAGLICNFVHLANLSLLAPSAVEWKEWYSVKGTIINSGTKNIARVNMYLYENGLIPPEATPSPYCLINVQPQESRDVTWAFRKDWKWWTEHVAVPLHDLSKDFQYHIVAECLWNDDIQRVLSSEYTTVRVSVPSWKSDLAYTSAADYSSAAALSVAAAALGASVIGLPAAAAAAAAQAAGLATSRALYEKMQDAPPLDRSPQAIAKVRTLPLRLRLGKTPLEKALREVAFGTRDFAAAFEFLNVSHSRAWTAFAYGDQGVLSQQARQVAKASRLVKERAKESIRHLNDLADETERAGVRLTDGHVVEFQHSLRREGLPKDEAVLLRSWGYTEEQIKSLTEALLHVDPVQTSELSKNLRLQASRLEKISEIIDTLAQEVQVWTRTKLPKERQQLLFEAGLLTLREVKEGKSRLTRSTARKDRNAIE